MINIKISNKAAYTIIGVFILLSASLAVYAFGTSDPQQMGHNANEISITNDGDTIKLSSAFKQLESKVDNIKNRGNIGGLYTKRGGKCRWGNPLNNGRCGCPSGYKSSLVMEDDEEGRIYQCYKK